MEEKREETPEEKEKAPRTEAQLRALEAGRKKMAEIRAAKKAAVGKEVRGEEEDFEVELRKKDPEAEERRAEQEVKKQAQKERETKQVVVRRPKKKRVIVIEESSSEEEIVVRKRERKVKEPEEEEEKVYPWTGKEQMWDDMFRMR